MSFVSVDESVELRVPFDEGGVTPASSIGSDRLAIQPSPTIGLLVCNRCPSTLRSPP